MSEQLLKDLDAGPWSLIFDGSASRRLGVISEDFKRDVVLWICGDFGSEEDHIEYARALANTLNAEAPPASVPDVEAKYAELLYAVASKFPHESRHETALRYIRQRESAPSQVEQAQRKENPNE